MTIVLILFIKNFFEILEIEKTPQNSFDRYARTFKSKYSGLNPGPTLQILVNELIQAAITFEMKVHE